MVLERLIAEGTFDWVDPNTLDVREELAMNTLPPWLKDF